jgi:type IV secretory pathway TrbD component
MTKYVLVLGGTAIALFLAGILVLVLFNKLWIRAGFGTALLVLAGLLILFAWLADRKGKRARAGLGRV